MLIRGLRQNFPFHKVKSRVITLDVVSLSFSSCIRNVTFSFRREEWLCREFSASSMKMPSSSFVVVLN